MENIKINITHRDLCDMLKEEFKSTYNINESNENITTKIHCLNHCFYVIREIKTKIGNHSAIIRDTLDETEMKEIIKQSFHYDGYKITNIKILGEIVNSDDDSEYFNECNYVYQGADISLEKIKDKTLKLTK